MLKKEIQDNIVIARISDGDTNAITIEILRELKAIIDEVNDTEALKGLVLTGEGRFFSSGFSLTTLIGFETGEAAVAFFEEQEHILLNYFTCKKPVVCALNGHAAAMGVILAMASDYRIAANHPKIKIGMSEIKIGLPLSVAQSAIVRFGLDSDKKYRDVMYFGEMMGPKHALEMGMVDEVVDGQTLIHRAKEIVCQWIDTPNRPFIHIKRELKADVVEKIRRNLDKGEWKSLISETMINKAVKDALTVAQAAMERKK
ncbi:MAG: hypothetical protein CSA29_03045 [Desulfobacterales bacterium]|nr:MAG: hypothetical protein CSA29_03045 [Desulfobacterales bacterium]